MDLRRLRAGEWITALAGAVLLVALFLPWYEQSGSAWESFSALDLILAIVAVAALAVVPVTAAQRVPAVPLAMETLLVLAALVGVVLVLVRVASPPGGVVGRDIGLWLGLAAVLAVAASAALAMRDERLSRGDRYVDLSGRPTPALAEIEVVPPPRPGQ